MKPMRMQELLCVKLRKNREPHAACLSLAKQGQTLYNEAEDRIARLIQKEGFSCLTTAVMTRRTII